MGNSNKHSISNKIFRNSWPILQVLVLLVLVRVLLNPKADQTTNQDSVEHPITIEAVQTLFPEASRLELSGNKTTFIYSVRDEMLGFAFPSEPSSYVGFGGPIPLLIAFDTVLNFVGLSLLPNAETPGYLNRIERSGFTQQWHGMKPEQIIATDLDAVSGATLSSTCIKQTLQNSLKIRMDRGELQSNLVSLPVPIKYPIWKWVMVGLNLLILFWALASFFWPKTLKPSRLFLLASSMIVLGFLQGRLLSLSLFEQWAIHTIFSTQAWFLMLVAVLALLLPMITGKRFYCIYLCPFGAIQELAGKLFPKRHVKLSATSAKNLSYLRQGYLLIIVLLLVLGIVTDLSVFEPFTAFLPDTAHSASLIIAGFMVLLSLFIPRFWCRFLCPSGFLIEQFQIKRK